MNTCGGCYLDKQKAGFMEDKLQAARVEAKKMATDTGETVGIYKVLISYKTIAVKDSAGFDIIEFISKYQ